MVLSNLLQRRHRTAFLAVASLFLLLTVVSIYRLPLQVRIRDYYHLPDTSTQASVGDTDTSPHQQSHDSPNREPLSLAPEYTLQPYEPPFCTERFGHQYLEKYRDTATGYCTPNSASNLTCFHGRTSSESSLDTFCLGKSAVFDSNDRKFALGCQLRALTDNETSSGIPEISALRAYWYETGPAVIFEKTIKIDPSLATRDQGRNFTILIKREGAYNTWHSLMEIWSLTMTLDILRMTREPTTRAPFFDVNDAENTRVLILDDHDDGPYAELWTMFAKRPTIRLKDLPATTVTENIIVPLPGSTNPFWSGDWEIHPCDHSDLLRAFSRRVLDFCQIDTHTQHGGDLILTFIDRKTNRRLIDGQSYLEELQAKVPHVKIQAIDFAALPFREQVRIARETDILVGVHGAGLTHGMFLPEGSVMVEILPETLKHKGFRNLAGILGHTYVSAHGTNPPGTHSKREDWQGEDVSIEKERFMDLMEIAIKSMYNKGLRNYDVN